MSTTSTSTGRSIGELLGELPRQFQKLIRTEVLMARSEVAENLGKMRAGAVLVGTGALVALAAFTVLLEGVAHSLVRAGLPQDVAELIVGSAVCVAGFAAVKTGINRLKAGSLVPQRTIEHLKRDVAAIDPMRQHHEQPNT